MEKQQINEAEGRMSRIDSELRLKALRCAAMAGVIPHEYPVKVVRTGGKVQRARNWTNVKMYGENGALERTIIGIYCDFEARGVLATKEGQTQIYLTLRRYLPKTGRSDQSGLSMLTRSIGMGNFYQIGICAIPWIIAAYRYRKLPKMSKGK